MKKYKPNFTIPFMYFMTTILLFTLPFVMILWTFIHKDRVVEALLVFPAYLLILLSLYLILEIVNLISKLCTKKEIIADDSKIHYDDRDIKYEFVDRIVLEKGLINKYNESKCSALVLFNKDQVLLNIKNPSIRLIFRTLKNCKGAKKEILNKIMLIILACLYGISFIIWLIMLLIF